MVNEDYEVKATVKRNYKSKHYDIAICPRGNQYNLKGSDFDHFLTIHGFNSVTEAKKEGWRFK